MKSILRLALILTAIAASSSLSGQSTPNPNWPRFRGPNGDGVAEDDPRLPLRWSRTQNLAWKTEIPGQGWSCPVVWDNRVFLTTVVSEKKTDKPKKGLYQGLGVRKPRSGRHAWQVYCLDLRSGDILWKRTVHAGEPAVPRHPKASYANETPATDGKRLYVLFGDLGLYCFDLDGKPLWSHKIEPKATLWDYGAAASPIVHEDRVIMVYDNQEESYIASYDAATGKQRWKRKRDEPSTWATPYIWKNPLRTELVVCGRNKNRAYDLQGNVLWEFNGLMSSLVIPSPFAKDGLLYLTSGYIGDPIRPVFAIKPGANGKWKLPENPADDEHIEWYLRKGGPYNASPIVYQGRYYTLFDRGFISCHDAKTGQEIYGKTRFAPGATFTASPWAYNGKLFCISEEGTTYVVEPGSRFQVLHQNKLDELTIATPAISQGRLLIRTYSSIYCFTNKP